MGKPQKQPSTPVISNRKAYRNYFIVEDMEAGVVLLGCEVKMVRQGAFSIAEAYCELRQDELWLIGSHIPEYPQASDDATHEPLRLRKLLLHKSELKRLKRKVQEKGMTVVPLKAYFTHGRVKMKIGLAQGKRQYDKRETIKQRDVTRDDSRVKS